MKFPSLLMDRPPPQGWPRRLPRLQFCAICLQLFCKKILLRFLTAFLWAWVASVTRIGLPLPYEETETTSEISNKSEEEPRKKPPTNSKDKGWLHCECNCRGNTSLATVCPCRILDV